MIHVLIGLATGLFAWTAQSRWWALVLATASGYLIHG